VNHIVIQYSSDNGVKIIRYGLRNMAKMRKSGIEGFGRCGPPEQGGRLTNLPPNTHAAYMHVLQINQPHAPTKARPARVIGMTQKERPRGGRKKGLIR
jgi:hypothetical protein